MRRCVFLLWLLLWANFGFAQNVVLVNGTIIDGTGKPRSTGSVRVRDGKVVDIGVFKPAPGEMLLDIKGMVVAPGFIDMSTLSPAAIAKDPAPLSLITQGVTTAVLGADGSGPYSIEEFMLPFDEKPAGLNIALLIGHGTVRRQIMGDDFKRSANADELERMSQLIASGMKQGAFGFATDLQQEPASFSTPEELLALTKIAGRLGGTLVIKLRDESKIPESVKEAVTLAREAKLPVQVVGANKSAMTEIEKARAQRVDIAADSYSFADLIREKPVMLERAIQRLSGTPAARIALRERGVLKRNAPADLVVFNPAALSSGMKYVFVNGMMTVKDGQPTDARAGQALR
jgi:N-acyl-D-amino-acid deacylase